MSGLPVLPASQIIKALKRAGFVEDRQRGSHVVLIHPQFKTRTVVPVHPGRDISKPLLKKILADAGLTVAQFSDLI
jgi:predicted RNA binding protein YcfA (HicA-like mRNA interferase family)